MSLSNGQVVVVGTVFVDVKCFPQQELNCKGRNLGRANFYHGGVGRNVAETMALLGSAVRFCSSVQQGGIGNEVLERLSEVAVDVQGVFTTPEPDGHGMWVAILQRDGDLACSISQMPDVRHMQQAWTRSGRRMLQDANLVVLELDLSVELAEAVLRDAARDNVPVVGLPGNFDCIRRQPSMLRGLHTFVCNQYEAEELYGKPVSSIPAAMHAALALLELGPRHVVVTLGALGCVAGDRSGAEPFYVPGMPVEVVDTTGAGDAFVAGLSHALSAGLDLHVAVALASRVAAWTVNASESVCRSLPSRIKADPWPGWSQLLLG